MRKEILTAGELTRIHSLVSEELESCVRSSRLIVEHGYKGRPMHQKCEGDIAELHSCLEKLLAMYFWKSEESND
jgi:hypothetical protein